MKTLLLCSLVLVASVNFAQTSVISLKSHHGTMSELNDSKDHFGMVMPAPKYDTLIRISGDCVVQIGSRAFDYHGEGIRFRDTVCDHWYYQQVAFDRDLISKYHGGNVEMIGFEKTDNYRIENSPHFQKRSVRQSSKILVILLVLIALGAYVIQPKLLWKK